MRNRNIGTVIALGLTASLALAGCGTQNTSASSESSSDAILRVGIQRPTSLIPGNSTGLFSNAVVGAVFDGLVDFDPETGEPRNLVASQIETTDQTVWNITLNDGWTFHNGEPVDAESFVRGWSSAVDPDNGWVQAGQFSNIVGYDEVAGAGGTSTAETMSGLVVVSDLELTVTLKTPNSQFPYLLGRPFYSPIPQAAIDDPDAFAEQPIGNGPYEMTAPWTGGDSIETARYDDYSGTETMNGGVLFIVYTGNDVAYTDYQAGEVDIVTLNSADIPQADASYPDLVKRSPADDWRNYLSMPTYLAGYDDPNIRKALSMAIDRQLIIDSLLDGEANIATDYDIPINPGYRDDACGATCEYDLDEARALWDAAPVKPASLSVTSVTGTGREMWAEAIGNQWSEAFDVSVLIEQVASENTWPGIKSQSVQSPVTLGSPANYPSSLDTLGQSYADFGDVNGSFYDNPEFNALLQDAAGAADAADQQAFYDEAKDLLIADSPSVLLWSYASTYVVSEQVASYVPDLFNKGQFAGVTISE